MEEIKNVMHLYLGCECVVDQGGGKLHETHIIGIHTNGNVQVAHAVESQDRWKSTDVKLFLRPLSDMTEEEKARVEEITHENFTTPLIQTYSEVTIYFLRQGFDVFGFIEAGLAIDKTKM